MSGGPTFVRSEYFNITAKAEEGRSGEDRMLLMIQSLLGERFSLRLHSQTKGAPVYFLVGGKGGKRTAPGLQVTTEGSCIKVDDTTLGLSR